MKKPSVVLIPVAVVTIGHLGSAYFHEDFQWYFCGSIIFLWGIVYLVLRLANSKAASAIAELPEERREEFLSELDAGQRRSVEAIMKRKLQNPVTPINRSAEET